MSASRIAVALVSLCIGGAARAQPAEGGAASSDGGAASSDGGAASAAEGALAGPRAAVASTRRAHAGSPVAQALDNFDFGDYEAVVGQLRPIVEALDVNATLPQKNDRLEALRIYGIACTLTDRRTAAEGAFLLLLREEPSTRLDPALVRPEAVVFFDAVRARHRDELLAAYHKTRPRHYWALNLIPLAGQLQNRQWRKAVLLGSLELAFLAGAIATDQILTSYQGDAQDFMPRGVDHRGAFAPLRDTNWVCVGLLFAVTGYGIADAFVVDAKRQQREHQFEARLGL